jgi:hypothetical protein
MESGLKRKARRTMANKPGRKPKPSAKQGFGFEMPPDRELIHIYFDQKGFTDQAAVFFQYYEEADWRSRKGTAYRNWKILATDWIYDYQQEIKLRKRLAANQSVFGDL